MRKKTREKISQGLKKYYTQLRNYREYTGASFRQARYRLRGKDWHEREIFVGKKKPPPPPPPPEPPPRPLKNNEYQFDFSDISETDYETKMIADTGLHEFLKNYIDERCYDEDDNAYRFDIHVTQVYAGVTHSESLLDWFMDAEVYTPKVIATIILIKLAKMKSAVPFLSRPAILTIVSLL